MSEPNLYSKLDTLTESIHNNHSEVVQRLSVLETKLEGLEKLPERVAALETEKARLSGGMAVWTLLGSGALSIITEFFVHLIKGKAHP